MSREDVRTNLDLSFARLTKSAKRWRDDFRKAKTQPAAVVRDEQLCSDHQEFLDKVENGEYEPGAFFKFLEDKNGES